MIYYIVLISNEQQKVTTVGHPINSSQENSFFSCALLILCLYLCVLESSFYDDTVFPMFISLWKLASIKKDMVEMRKIRSNDLVYFDFSSSTTVRLKAL